MPNIDVSIIIINFNTVKMTSDCIGSLFSVKSSILFEIILVDNGSSDLSREVFSNDERINYIFLSENLGFGAANNIGVKNASGKYLLFLNSDTYLTADLLSKFFNFCENKRSENIGAVGACLVSSDGVDVQSFGEFPSSKRLYRRLIESTKMANIISYDDNIYVNIDRNNYAEVDFLSGADFNAIRASINFLCTPMIFLKEIYLTLD